MSNSKSASNGRPPSSRAVDVEVWNPLDGPILTLLEDLKLALLNIGESLQALKESRSGHEDRVLRCGGGFLSAAEAEAIRTFWIEHKDAPESIPLFEIIRLDGLIRGFSEDE